MKGGEEMSTASRMLFCEGGVRGSARGERETYATVGFEVAKDDGGDCRGTG